jgi:hypothetical protein
VGVRISSGVPNSNFRMVSTRGIQTDCISSVPPTVRSAYALTNGRNTALGAALCRCSMKPPRTRWLPRDYPEDPDRDQSKYVTLFVEYGAGPVTP